MSSLVKSFQELKSLKKTLDQQRKAAQKQEELRQAELQRANAEANLFRRSVGAVHPLPMDSRAHATSALPKPIPRQRQLDEALALQEALSDEMDVERLLETDESLSYRRSGIGPQIVKRLRRGAWAVQGQIDLHGFRTEEARSELAQFIQLATKKEWRCVRVVYGKGHGSPGKVPVLKTKVHRWLVQKQEVMAFVQARPSEGGAGALIVLLQAKSFTPSEA